MIQRTAYLVRLSRDDLKQPGSLDDKFRLRLSMCDDLADRHKVPHADTSDRFCEQVSGAKLAKRPQMLELLDRVRSGYYTHVITPYQDRLLRGDKHDEADIEDAFLRGEIVLITTEGAIVFDANYDTSYAQLFESRASNARQYLRDFKKKVKETNVARAKEGKRGGGFAPYGYVWIPAQYDFLTRELIQPSHYEIRAELELADAAAALHWAQSQTPPVCLTATGELDRTAYLAIARRFSPHGGRLLPGIVCTGGEYFWLSEAFRRIRMEGLTQICADFNARLLEQGEPVPAGKRRGKPATNWQTPSLSGILDNPHHAGYPVKRWEVDRWQKQIKLEEWIWSREEQTYPHPVTLEEWEQLKTLRHDRRAGLTGKPRSIHLLSGTLHCWQDRPMRSGNAESYRCRCKTDGMPHPNGGINSHLAEGVALHVLKTTLEKLPTDRTPLYQADTQDADPLALRHARDAVSAKRKALDELRQHEALFVRSGTAAAFAQAVATAEADLQTAAATLDNLRRKIPRFSIAASLTLLDSINTLGFDAFWEKATSEQRRAVLQGVISRMNTVRPDEGAYKTTAIRVTVQPWIALFYNPDTVIIRDVMPHSSTLHKGQPRPRYEYAADSIPLCPRCQDTGKVQRWGLDPKRRPRFRCSVCNHQFAENPA